MTFDELKKKAVAEWEALQQSSKPRILVGTATCGRSSGAMGVLKAFKEETAKRGVDAIIFEVGCIGLCYAEPIIEIAKPGRARILYAGVNAKVAAQLVEDYLVNDNPRPDLALGTLGDATIEGIPKFFDLPTLKPQVRIVLRNCGNIDPTDLNHYIANGGYAALDKALKMTPEQVIAEVKKSGLRGRGGAGFPTATKWEFCRASPGTEKYLICNADEGDPGAFMNRSVLESDPHAVLEGMLLAAYAIGATHGYIYCRAEYPLALERLYHALDRMEQHNLLGDNILGTRFSFHMKIKEGAGAFVCGEETALMASIEGKRGMPRPRPPFPANSGLWGKPTNINNVETLSVIPQIVDKGGDWYAGHGPQNSKGSKTFCLVGKVARSGLVEIPLGTKLRDIIYGAGGGILNDKKFKAVQTGGPSGGCLSAEKLDLPIDYDNLAAAGSIMGSGGMIVADENTCMVDLSRFFLTFTQAESCGKCVPCRVGTRQMLNILERITQGKGEPGDIPKLESLADTIKSGALCALGGTAPNPVLTSLRYFRDEYEAHVNNKRCPALVCKSLISYYILPEKCQGCMICARNCPADAIKGGKRMVHVIDQEKCVKCGSCLDVCPDKFCAIIKMSGEPVPAGNEPVPVGASK